MKPLGACICCYRLQLVCQKSLFQYDNNISQVYPVMFIPVIHTLFAFPLAQSYQASHSSLWTRYHLTLCLFSPYPIDPQACRLDKYESVDVLMHVSPLTDPATSSS